MKYGERHKPWIKKSDVYCVMAQIVHEAKGAIEAVVRRRITKVMYVHELKIHKIHKSHAYELKIHKTHKSHAYELKVGKIHKNNAYKLEVDKIIMRTS